LEEESSIGKLEDIQKYIMLYMTVILFAISLFIIFIIFNINKPILQYRCVELSMIYDKQIKYTLLLVLLFISIFNVLCSLYNICDTQYLYLQIPDFEHLGILFMEAPSDLGGSDTVSGGGDTGYPNSPPQYGGENGGSTGGNDDDKQIPRAITSKNDGPLRVVDSNGQVVPIENWIYRSGPGASNQPLCSQIADALQVQKDLGKRNLNNWFFAPHQDRYFLDVVEGERLNNGKAMGALRYYSDQFIRYDHHGVRSGMFNAKINDSLINALKRVK
jgi:hypothetical protein